MLRFEQAHDHFSNFLQFRGNQTFDRAPVDALRLYYDRTAQNLLVSRNGGAYGLLRGTSDAEQWNVPGDGVADASDALRTLLARGDDVTLEAGATYLLSKPLVLLPGQTLRGNGATLKRRNQIVTTTTTALSAGVTTQVSLASVTGFVVGMQVAALNGSSWDSSPKTITAISGNTITVSPAFGITAAGTTTIFLTWHVVETAADARILDVVIDGNKGNWTVYRFEVTRDINIRGHRAGAVGCYVHDSPGEAIDMVAGDYQYCERCWIKNVNGNGIHMGDDGGGINYPVIAHCWVENCNLDVSVAHADGCIIWSNTIAHALVIGCTMINGIAGIGSIDFATNSDVTVMGCTIRNCPTYAIDIHCAGDDGPERILFANNRIYDCGPIQIQNTSASTADWPKDLTLIGNQIYNTRLNAQKVQRLSLLGNTFHAPADGTNKLLLLENVQHAVVEGNFVVGGSQGVWIDSTGTATKDVTVRGNHLINQKDRGIQVVVAGLDNILVDGNTIENDASADAGYDGIIVRDRNLCRGNVLTLVKGHAGIYPQSGAIVEGNTVRHGAATYSIRADGGTSGVIIRHNTLTLAVSNGSPGGNPNGDVANLTIS